jgi:glycosyltransferase involved in cell wall biosynthesis
MGFSINQAQIQIGRRYRQIRRLWELEGIAGINSRARRAASEWIAPKSRILPVRPHDVIAADLSSPFEAPIPPIVQRQNLIVNWVTTPPSRGSGGHTTMFRMVRYLESHGYRSRIYFYDVYRGDHRYYETIVRDYYDFHGPVANVESGMEDAHCVVATAWQSAYAIFNSRCAGKRFYFVQDYEPDFYPAGTSRLLAENSYRMGFHGISIGRCFAERLQREFGMAVEAFTYGCDTSKYRRIETPRSGIVFYARRETERRGFELGIMSIELFAKRHPEIEIHIYGDKLGKMPFAFHDHGRISPSEINAIYNRCYAGLSLSFTNVSLVALEMLAAGCIPVVNDTVDVRTDLSNDFARYTPPYPQAFASALESVVMDPDHKSLSAAAAGSVKGISWDDAGAKVDQIMRGALVRDSKSPIGLLQTEEACTSGRMLG